MKEIIFNAIIFNRGRRFRGYLLTRDGKITAVRAGDPSAVELADFDKSERTDLGGHWLLPGVIDSHVHFRDPGLTHKADIATESRAAVAGGVTSFFDMPNTKPPTVTRRALEDKYAHAERCSKANYAFFIGAAADNIEELRSVDYSRVPGIKLFLGSSTGNMCVSDPEALDEIFRLPALIAVHCEDEQTILANAAKVKQLYPQGEVPVAWHPVIRSELACYLSTRSAVERARRLGTRLHVCHLTTAQELELFRGQGADRRITCEACVAHLRFTDSDYPRLGSYIKCNPAVKSDASRDALRRALLTGDIDTVSTDHAPHTLEEKEGDAFTAPSGMPMVQFSLRAMLQLTLELPGLTPERVVQLMCHNQADLFGVSGRGYLEPGMWADMVEVNPDGTKTPVSNRDVVSKCGWTPMQGAVLQHEIRRTWVNGVLSFDAANPDLLRSQESAAMPLRFVRGNTEA